MDPPGLHKLPVALAESERLGPPAPAAWYLGEDAVAFMPSRGVRFGSGLEPPPHLVGERARALEALAAGGLVCVSAAAAAEPMPPLLARPGRLDLTVGDAPGTDELAQRLVLAGYHPGERGEGRGDIAGRGGVV